MEKSFVEALQCKYQHDDSQSDSFCEIYVPKGAPGTTALADLVVPTEIALDNCGITHAGKDGEIASVCGDARLLDLSTNSLSQWNEVFKILEQLPLVRTVNISSNPLQRDDTWNSCTDASLKFPNIIKLALNSTYITWPCLSSILQHFPSLEELYLSLNPYKFVDIVGSFPQVKRLHFNNNKIADWRDVCKLSHAFPNLEYLVLLENPIGWLGECDAIVSSTPHLQYLNLGQCLIDKWEEIDKIRHFPKLTDIRLQGNPLFQGIPEKERRELLIARLPNIDKLNASKVHDTEREDAERAFIRLFMDKDPKPPRFYELEEKYGKLDPLAKVSLKPKDQVKVTVHFEGKVHEMVFSTTETFLDVKKKLKTVLEVAPSKMRLFYHDIGAPYGMEEICISKRALHSHKVKDGDEFHIDRKL